MPKQRWPSPNPNPFRWPPASDDWDAEKLEHLAKEYISMRKEIWQGLAARTGEKWMVVEAKVTSCTRIAALAV